MLGAVIGQPLKDMPYAARLAVAQAAGIAIWDIYASCGIAGSLIRRYATPSPTILPRTGRIRGAGATAHMLNRPARRSACAEIGGAGL